MTTYKTKYTTKFLTIRKGRALSGRYEDVPVGTELKPLQKTIGKRALFSADVCGQTLYGYQDVEFLDVPRNGES